MCFIIASQILVLKWLNTGHATWWSKVPTSHSDNALQQPKNWNNMQIILESTETDSTRLLADVSKM